MLSITARCAGLLLLACAAVQGASVVDSEHVPSTKQKTVVMMQDILLVFGPRPGVGGPCYGENNCTENQYCSTDMNVCECLPGYHQTVMQPHNQQACTQCPELHHMCEDCCYPANETRCYNGVCQCKYESTECRTVAQDQFKIATQIALISAIILVIACLLVILWRTCRKQHGQRQRRRGQRRSDASEASLTSVQLRVVERLRNRPPGYHDRSHIRIEKPPSYEETIGQPLRYPALVLDPMHSPLDEPPDFAEATNGQLAEGATCDCGHGVDNAAFVDEELASKEEAPPALHM